MRDAGFARPSGSGAADAIRTASGNSSVMTPEAARRLVKRHGVLLEAARGPVPNLAERVAGEPIRGSWWAHPRGHEIFALTRAIRDSRDVLVCRAVGGKITYVHRRVWPWLVRLDARFERRGLAALREVHTSSGHHELRTVPYPGWVPAEVRKAAARLTEAAAARILGDWMPTPAPKRGRKGSR